MQRGCGNGNGSDSRSDSRGIVTAHGGTDGCQVGEQHVRYRGTLCTLPVSLGVRHARLPSTAMLDTWPVGTEDVILA